MQYIKNTVYCSIMQAVLNKQQILPEKNVNKCFQQTEPAAEHFPVATEIYDSCM